MKAYTTIESLGVTAQSSYVVKVAAANYSNRKEKYRIGNWKLEITTGGGRMTKKRPKSRLYQHQVRLISPETIGSKIDTLY